MSAVLAAVAKKIALMLATDKRFWTGVFSVIVGFVLLIVLLIGMVFSLFSFGNKHNTDLVNLIFHPELPIENLLDSEPQYYHHITAAREHLAEVKTEAEKINAELPQPEDDTAPKGIDVLRAQVIYYVLFLESNTFANMTSKTDFIACFYEKIGDIFSVIEDEAAIYGNIETLIARPITEDEKKNIADILNTLSAGGSVFLSYPGEYGPPIEPEYMTSITSYFGYRADPFTGETKYHNGTDFAWGGCYGANIYAAGAGTVTRASDVGDGFGKCVVIDHGGGIQTYYAHCSSISVHVGDTVVKGHYISKIGSTGRSTGPHLHFGLKINGVWADALSLYQTAP